MLLHVVDAAAPDLDRRIAAVREVLNEIDGDRVPELLVFNQIDKLPAGVGQAIAARYGGVAVSALERQGLGELLQRADAMLWASEDGAGLWEGGPPEDVVAVSGG